MKNRGYPPNCDRCDIKFRNGTIKRDIDPKKYRWKPRPTGESDFDIIEWQKS